LAQAVVGDVFIAMEQVEVIVQYVLMILIAHSVMDQEIILVLFVTEQATNLI
jgi:hypothetical protein